MASISSQATRDWDAYMAENEPLVFSDEEDATSDYNYYTDEDSEESSFSTEYESEHEYQGWDYEQMIRGFGALMMPVMVSVGIGAYLAHLKGRNTPEAWFWGSSASKDPNAPVVLKKNELGGRIKCMQYPANSPCQDRLACK